MFYVENIFRHKTFYVKTNGALMKYEKRVRLCLSLRFQKMRFKNVQFENVIFKNAVKRLAKSGFDL